MSQLIKKNKFLKEVTPELKKDLFKDATKYLIVLVLGPLILWIGSLIAQIKSTLFLEIKVSYLFIVLIWFLSVILSSFITFLLFDKRYQKLRKDSLRDDLTGLFNYKAVPIKLEQAITIAKREKKEFSIILVDIDDFKSINDKFLYSGGDRLMQQLGAYLLNDSRANDIVCRLHLKGDEILIIAIGTNKNQARMAAERKRNEIEQTDFQISGSQLVNITASFGIAEYVNGIDSVESILEKANQALLNAKKLGKNKSVVYE